MNAVYELIYSTLSDVDFDDILDHYDMSYIAFGEAPDLAFEKALERLKSIKQDINRLTTFPYRGTLHDDIAVGVRHITMGKVVVWFEILENPKAVNVLGIFLSAQDHFAKILERLKNP